MNNKQKTAVILGLFVAFIMILIPPWQSSSYAFIFDPPQAAENIDFKRLLLQLAMAAILSGSLFLATAGHQDKLERSDQAESPKADAPYSKQMIIVLTLFILATLSVLGFHLYGKHQAEVEAEEESRRQAALAREWSERQADALRQQAQQKAAQEEALRQQEQAAVDAHNKRLRSAAAPKQWKVAGALRGVQVSLQTYWKESNLYYRLQLRGSPEALEMAAAMGVFNVSLFNSDNIPTTEISVNASALRSYRDRNGTLSIMASDNNATSCSLEEYETLTGARLQ